MLTRRSHSYHCGQLITHRAINDIPWCIKAKKDPTWLDDQGLVAWSTAQQYCDIIDAYLASGHNSSGYSKMYEALKILGKKPREF